MSIVGHVFVFTRVEGRCFSATYQLRVGYIYYILACLLFNQVCARAHVPIRVAMTIPSYHFPL